VDGIVGPNTWNALFGFAGPDFVYRTGLPMMRGFAIAMWQRRANDRGQGLQVDGIYGPRSRAAAEAVQREAGLTVDGIVGPCTWAATFG
jgi:peptidoglycan hydrolase-like protein with peptidoglycan-binding domain